jgi:hypothetical protein
MIHIFAEVSSGDDKSMLGWFVLGGFVWIVLVAMFVKGLHRDSERRRLQLFSILVLAVGGLIWWTKTRPRKDDANVNPQYAYVREHRGIFRRSR